MDESGFRRWLKDYTSASRSNDPAAIKALFAADARYYTNPWAKPWTGHDEIVEEWTGDEAADLEFESRTDVIAIQDGRGAAKWWAKYHDADLSEFKSVFIVEFDEKDRCREFVEYYVSRERGENPDAD